MPESLRRFQVADPFGRSWDVEFRWHQNAISIRHADAVDVKYEISQGDERRELIVCLPHPLLIQVAGSLGRQVTDPWCMRLAAAHARAMISDWRDMEKPFGVASAADLEAYARAAAS